MKLLNINNPWYNRQDLLDRMGVGKNQMVTFRSGGKVKGLRRTDPGLCKKIMTNKLNPGLSKTDKDYLTVRELVDIINSIISVGHAINPESNL